jgi:hypothetical protein
MDARARATAGQRLLPSRVGQRRGRRLGGGLAGVIVHWDGTRWSAVDSATVRDLRAIWGSGPQDVWAVGERGTMVHWDGTPLVARADGHSDRPQRRSGAAAPTTSGPRRRRHRARHEARPSPGETMPPQRVDSGVPARTALSSSVTRISTDLQPHQPRVEILPARFDFGAVVVGQESLAKFAVRKRRLHVRPAPCGSRCRTSAVRARGGDRLRRRAAAGRRVSGDRGVPSDRRRPHHGRPDRRRGTLRQHETRSCPATASPRAHSRSTRPCWTSSPARREGQRGPDPDSDQHRRRIAARTAEDRGSDSKQTLGFWTRNGSSCARSDGLPPGQSCEVWVGCTPTWTGSRRAPAGGELGA